MNNKTLRIVVTTITMLFLSSFLAEVRVNAKDEQHYPLTSFTVIAEGKNGKLFFQIGIEKEKLTKLTEAVFKQNSVSMGAVDETISSM